MLDISTQTKKLYTVLPPAYTRRQSELAKIQIWLWLGSKPDVRRLGLAT